MATINLEKKPLINLRKHDNLGAGLGKYSGIHGVIRKNEVTAASPTKGISARGIGKGLNYPMDSDQEFEKRVKRYQRQQREAAEAAMRAKIASPLPASKMSAVSA